MTIIRWIYNLLFPVVVIVMLPGFVWRMFKRGKYRHKFLQRFAIYSRHTLDRLAPDGWTWIHAVSVGEVLIALKLIRRLRERDPGRRFVLSTTTSTGFALASENRSDWLEAIYHPLDFYPIAMRALRVIRPIQMILVEAEVWPNLVCEARRQGIPVVLVNARLSPRSESRFRRFRAITGPVFDQLSEICVQDPEDIERWRSLGVRRAKVTLTGSIKFDDAFVGVKSGKDLSEVVRAFGLAGRPVLIGASTHAGEEVVLGRVLLALRERGFRDLVLISVPRHFERAKEVRAGLEELGLTVALRSQPAVAGADVLLVDVTGELRAWYAQAQVAFVGKSLTAKGGQNPAEPILAGCPVVVGPNMQNFTVLVRRLVRDGGADQVQSEAELVDVIAKLLTDRGAAEARVSVGRTVIASHRGATDRTCDVLAACLES